MARLPLKGRQSPTHHLVDLFHRQTEIGGLEAGPPVALQQRPVVHTQVEVVPWWGRNEGG